MDVRFELGTICEEFSVARAQVHVGRRKEVNGLTSEHCRHRVSLFQLECGVQEDVADVVSIMSLPSGRLRRPIPFQCPRRFHRKRFFCVRSSLLGRGGSSIRRVGHRTFPSVRLMKNWTLEGEKPWSQKRVLVTGGNGFLGRAVVAALRSRGARKSSRRVDATATFGMALPSSASWPRHHVPAAAGRLPSISSSTWLRTLAELAPTAHTRPSSSTTT
jgi:hypothetical protein